VLSRSRRRRTPSSLQTGWDSRFHPRITRSVPELNAHSVADASADSVWPGRAMSGPVQRKSQVRNGSAMPPLDP